MGARGLVVIVVKARAWHAACNSVNRVLCDLRFAIHKYSTETPHFCMHAMPFPTIERIDQRA